MIRCGFSLLLIACLAGPDAAPAALTDALITETDAARHGLTRAWFTQVELDRASSRLIHLVLQGKTLYAQTDRAVLHAIDAETGQTLWVARVGRPGGLSMAPAANDRMVAVVNGSYLYVLDKNTGKVSWQTQLDGAPGTGPVLSAQRVYVSMTNGMILSYRLTPVKSASLTVPATETPAVATSALAAPRAAASTVSPAVGSAAPASADQPVLQLEKNLAAPLACQSTGRTLVRPVLIRETAGEEFVAWPTDAGYLYVAGINRAEEDRFSIRYRLETAAGIAASPAYLRGDPKTAGGGAIFVPGQDGFVYALREQDGQTLWRFPAAEPLVEPVAAIDGHLYVPTQLGGMYCLDVATGQQLWWTPDVIRFVAASKDRVYAADKLGDLQVISAANGARLDTIPAIGLPLKLFNVSNDRIYLATESGLIQCLHETGLPQPLVHDAPPAAKPAPEKPATTKARAAKPATAPHPPASHPAAPPMAHPAAPAAPRAKPARPLAKQPVPRQSNGQTRSRAHGARQQREAAAKSATGKNPFGG